MISAMPPTASAVSARLRMTRWRLAPSRSTSSTPTSSSSSSQRISRANAHVGERRRSDGVRECEETESPGAPLIFEGLAELHAAIVYADVWIATAQFDHLRTREQHRAVAVCGEHVHRAIHVEH